MEHSVEEAIDRLLDIVADNIRELMNNDRRLLGKNRPNELALAAGVGKGTVQRILRGSAKDEDDPAPNAAKIDTLMRLAWYFEKPIWKLFIPNDRMSRVFDSQDAAARADEVPPPRDLKRHRR